LFNKVYVDEIIAHVKSLERGGWKGTPPWSGSTAIHLNSGEPQATFLKHSLDYGNSDVWLQLLQNTKQGFDIMGISLSSWKRTRRFSEILKEKAASGCKIRLLLMDKENPTLRHLINEAIPETRYSAIIREIEEMFLYYSEIAAQEPNIEARTLRNGCPHFQLTRSDQYAVYVMYLYSERSHHTPLWQCPQGLPLYTALAQEFNTLWEVNGSPSAPEHRRDGELKPKVQHQPGHDLPGVNP
jgi:hypothetical protein